MCNIQNRSTTNRRHVDGETWSEMDQPVEDQLADFSRTVTWTAHVRTVYMTFSIVFSFFLLRGVQKLRASFLPACSLPCLFTMKSEFWESIHWLLLSVSVWYDVLVISLPTSHNKEKKTLKKRSMVCMLTGIHNLHSSKQKLTVDENLKHCVITHPHTPNVIAMSKSTTGLEPILTQISFAYERL